MSVHPCCESPTGTPSCRSLSARWLGVAGPPATSPRPYVSTTGAPMSTTALVVPG